MKALYKEFIIIVAPFWKYWRKRMAFGGIIRTTLVKMIFPRENLLATTVGSFRSSPTKALGNFWYCYIPVVDDKNIIDILWKPNLLLSEENANTWTRLLYFVWKRSCMTSFLPNDLRSTAGSLALTISIQRPLYVAREAAFYIPNSSIRKSNPHRKWGEEQAKSVMPKRRRIPPQKIEEKTCNTGRLLQYWMAMDH